MVTKRDKLRYGTNVNLAYVVYRPAAIGLRGLGGQVLQGKTTLLQVVSILTACSMCGYSCIFPIYVLFRVKYIPSYFHKWNKLDKLLGYFEVKDTSVLEQRSRYAVFGIWIGCLLFALFWNLNAWFFPSDFIPGISKINNFTEALLMILSFGGKFIIFVIQLNAELGFVTFSWLLQTRFRFIVAMIERDFTLDPSSLERLRFICQEMEDLRIKTNNLCMPCLSLTFATSAMHTCSTLFVIVEVFFRHEQMTSTAIYTMFAFSSVAVISLIRILYIILCATNVQKETTKIKRALLRKPIAKLKVNELIHFQVFLNQCNYMETQLSVGGFFDMNKSLFTKIIGFIITYTVVLIQFRQ